eukprot:Platyproteum_vivax@DN3610_c0_g1_i2.p1
MGLFLGGTMNKLGETLPLSQADEHMFGLVLLNDWTSRDVQRWEMAPLGPFLSKSFCTSISPWIITMEALAPYRIPLGPQDPPPLKYLRHEDAEVARAGLDVSLEVKLKTTDSDIFNSICSSNLSHIYWSLAQQVTHHASSGTPLRPGDLCGTGTLSGPEPHELGCLVEITQAGKKPLQLPNGEKRTYLQDGDTVIFEGFAENDAGVIGFGTCEGIIKANSNLVE